MSKFTSSILLLVASLSSIVLALPRVPIAKSFSYEGNMPIREDESAPAKSNETSVVTIKPEDQAAAEAACWNLIRDESVVTFALQNRVLDRLQIELANLTMKAETREKIDNGVKSLKRNMLIAGNALNSNEADVFFDSLFESSEDIIQLASYLRDPTLEDGVFMALGKAVSYLGRNNAALITEFTQMCSFIRRSPKPRRWFSYRFLVNQKI